VGGAEDDEGITVFGRSEGVHPEARHGRHAGCGCLPKDGVSQATYFNWKKYDNLLPMRRLKQIENENNKLKRIVAGIVDLDYFRFWPIASFAAPQRYVRSRG
jgi:hypothetical protein